MGKLQNPRIIFLDIDGVLNSNNFYVNRDKKKVCQKESFTGHIDPIALHWLDELCKEIDAKVIISSTWRIGMTIEQMQKNFNEMGATFKIIGTTPVLPYSMCRGLEIQEWIYENIEESYNYKNYVIIDDDSDFFIQQAPHFFNTDNFVGMTPTTCYQIKRFFGVI